MKLSSNDARKLGLVPKKKRDAEAARRRREHRAAEARRFDKLCIAHGLPVPVHEFPFHPTRKWRFDYLFHGSAEVALEVEGGAWAQGRHVRAPGFFADMEKYNEAQILGYIVLRCTPEDVQSGAVFALVKRALA